MIDENGKQMGVVPLQKALQMSIERNLDLVQVTSKVSPPVCRIVDHGKYLYQLKKKEKKHSRQKGGEIKGVRLRFNTSKHDLETKARQAHKFLEQGNKIKAELLLRGREKALRQHAQEQISKFLEILKGYGPIEIDQPSKRQPRGITVIIKKGQMYGQHEDKSENQKIVNQKI